MHAWRVHENMKVLHAFPSTTPSPQQAQLVIPSRDAPMNGWFLPSKKSPHLARQKFNFSVALRSMQCKLCSFMLTSPDGGRGLEFSQLRIAYGNYQANRRQWWNGVANSFKYWCCNVATSHLIPGFWFRLPSCPFFHSCHSRWCQGFQIVWWSCLQKGMTQSRGLRCIGCPKVLVKGPS